MDNQLDSIVRYYKTKNSLYSFNYIVIICTWIKLFNIINTSVGFALMNISQQQLYLR